MEGYMKDNVHEQYVIWVCDMNTCIHIGYGLYYEMLLYIINEIDGKWFAWRNVKGMYEFMWI